MKPPFAADPIRAAVLPLRVVFTAVPLLAGLDKFFGLLADWQGYLSPFVRDHLPVAPGVFLGAVGVVEIGVGVLMATRHARLAAQIACVWLSLIAVQLVAAGRLDVAVRDLALAVAAATLWRLTPGTRRAARTRDGAVEAAA